ncbi:MAG TPA: PAS domain-containing protein [Polyangiaceae bacterium]|nr:PAS domain-containing protein [Polyangiaceae bacterium]
MAFRELMSQSPKCPGGTPEEELRCCQATLDGTPVPILSSDLAGNILSANRAWLGRMGYLLPEVVGTPASAYLIECSRQRFEDACAELLRGGTMEDVEVQAITRGGEVIDVVVSGRLVHDGAGRPERLVTTLLDVTRRMRAEAALRLRESYLTAMIENQPGLVWLKDAEGRFIAVNRAFARSTGKDDPAELVGKTDHDVWPRELAEKYRADDAAVMRSGAPVQVEEQIFDAGERRWFETFKTPVRDRHGAIVGTTGYARDITARKLEEEALQRVQKLESLGVLAGGIAHDFNNLLTGIFGCIDLALESTAEPAVKETLSKALGAIDRSRALTQQLLTFAEGGAPIKQVGSLGPFLRQTAEFALSGARAACTFRIPADLWCCDFDRNQIGQVIDNVVINAQQAMPDGGEIELSAENVTLVDDGVRAQPAPGHYVKISIADRGPGIAPEILPRIFDPFFTTKRQGHGLGLATAYSIVDRHGGHIEVDSTPGQGSVFHVYLPALPGASPGRRSTAPPPPRSPGTVIVMDDEEIVRFALGRVLESLGYSVITTANGGEAIAALRRERAAARRVDAMILDLTVAGGMGGREAVSELRALEPELPIYVASGYADDPIMASPAAYGFTDSIGKPFSRAELMRLLRGG